MIDLVTNPEMMMITTLILGMRGIAFMAVGS
jgi:hypothetical protein